MLAFVFLSIIIEWHWIYRSPRPIGWFIIVAAHENKQEKNENEYMNIKTLQCYEVTFTNAAYFAFKAANLAGKAPAINAGFSGFKAGFNAGFNTGFNAGFNAGLNAGLRPIGRNLAIK